MRPHISKDICTDCGECKSICPYDVFEDTDGVITVETPEDCIECGVCVESCPQRAISMDD